MNLEIKAEKEQIGLIIMSQTARKTNNKIIFSKLKAKKKLLNKKNY